MSSVSLASPFAPQLFSTIASLVTFTTSSAPAAYSDVQSAHCISPQNQHPPACPDHKLALNSFKANLLELQETYAALLHSHHGQHQIPARDIKQLYGCKSRTRRRRSKEAECTSSSALVSSEEASASYLMAAMGMTYLNEYPIPEVMTARPSDCKDMTTFATLTVPATSEVLSY